MDANLVYADPAVAELATAAQDGSRLKVAALAAAGVDKNARGDKGINLLQWSILHQSNDGLDALLKAGADPAIQDASGSTAMHFAAGTSDPSFLATLLRMVHRSTHAMGQGRHRFSPLCSAAVTRNFSN